MVGLLLFGVVLRQGVVVACSFLEIYTLLKASLNRVLVCNSLFYSFSVCLLSSTSPTLKTPMVGGKSSKGNHDKKSRSDKRKRPPTPPSDDFSDSKYPEERFFSEGKESPPPVPPSLSSVCMDDSMGPSTTERAYI